MSARPLKLGAVLLGLVAASTLVAAAGGAPAPLDPRLQVRLGSRVLPDGTFVPGAVLDSRSAARRFPALASLTAALTRVPAALVPARIWVDVEPRGDVGRVEFHTDAGALLIGRGVTELSTSVWLHELGHVRMRGARPRGTIARRLLRAVDEGAADYFAACLGHGPRVGDASELRDLTHPPPIGASEWATLALPGFDAHRMGWALAGRLYAAQPACGSLLRDLVTCLDGASALEGVVDSPAAAVGALLAACPAASRKPLARTLRAWLPAELANWEDPP